MSLPALWSCWQVYLIGMVALLANALLVSLKAGGGEPANFSRTITLSIVFGEPPSLSLLVEVSQRPPSGDLMPLRSRPHLLWHNAPGVSVPVPAELMFMTHSREPRIAAM